MDHLVYTYENMMGGRFDFHKAIESETGVKAVILRDPFNLLCSLYKHIERGSKFWFYNKCTDKGIVKKEKLVEFAKAWITHAELYESAEDVVGINYNKWCDSESYRDELFTELKLSSRSDRSMDNVSRNGGGSSFERMSKDGKAQEMKTRNRFDEFRGQEWFEYFVENNPKLVETSNRLFGDLLCLK
jgi:hypothetical protein